MCQIIEKVTQVSGTARSLNPKGINDVFNSEVQDRLVETKSLSFGKNLPVSSGIREWYLLRF